MEESMPALCEPGVKYFIGGTLKECHKFKERHMSMIFNIAMTFMLVAVVSGFLVYRYKGKLTPSELAIKSRKKQEYIVSKLQLLSAVKQKKSQDMITNLPSWHDNPEVHMFQRKI